MDCRGGGGLDYLDFPAEPEPPFYYSPKGTTTLGGGLLARMWIYEYN